MLKVSLPADELVTCINEAFRASHEGAAVLPPLVIGLEGKAASVPLRHTSHVTRHSVLHGTGVVRPPCPSPNSTPRYLRIHHHSTPKTRTNWRHSPLLAVVDLALEVAPAHLVEHVGRQQRIGASLQLGALFQASDALWRLPGALDRECAPCRAARRWSLGRRAGRRRYA